MTQGGRQTHQRQERKSDLMSFSRGSLKIKEESCQVKHDDGINSCHNDNV